MIFFLAFIEAFPAYQRLYDILEYIDIGEFDVNVAC